MRGERVVALSCVVLGCLAGVAESLMPVHSWETLPLFLHIRWSNFSSSDVERMARNFSMITVQPNVPYPPLGEGQAQWVKEHVQQVNPAVPVLMYYNTYFADPLYAYEKVVAEHPSWWLYDGGKPFQPGGRYVFNMSSAAARSGWVEFYAGVQSRQQADGGYADSGCGTQVPFLPPAERQAFAAGQYLAQNAAQAALGPSAVFVSNCPIESTTLWQPQHVNGFMYESFCSDFRKGGSGDHWCKDETFWVLAASQSGNVSVLQLRYYLNRANGYNPEYGIAAALIMGTDKTWFGASVSWDWDGDWSKWYPEYDEPLGTPGPPHMVDADGCVWNRTFASGAKVSVGYCNTRWAQIVWPSGRISGERTIPPPNSAQNTQKHTIPPQFNLRGLGDTRHRTCNPHEALITGPQNEIVCLSIKPPTSNSP